MSEAPANSGLATVPDRQPGRQLAAARANCGLSVADVARHLKLSAWQIDALEADDYRRLPGAVFVRGFIRNYAHFVKLDPASLLAHAQQSAPPVALPEISSSVATFPIRGGLRWHKYAVVAIVALIPVVIFEFYADGTPDVTVKSTRHVALLPPVPVAPEPAPQLVVVAAKPTTTKLPTADSPAGMERKAGEHFVKFTFDQESWVEVRDRHGRRILSQLNSAGTEQVVSGLPPLSVVVGNAAGVRLLYNDQLVDLAPHVKIDVARLTLE